MTGGRPGAARRDVDVEPDRPLDPRLEGHASRLVHGGEDPETSAVPLYLGNTTGDTYARFRNPTVQAFEATFRALDRSAAVVATASGMAAISQTLLAVLRAGDVLVAHEGLFVGSRALLFEGLGGLGIRVETADPTDRRAVAAHLRAGARAVFVESMTHPEMRLADVPGIAAEARAAGALSIVDNSCLTPVLFNPLEHGADLVVHSASKYVGGHGDALGGVVSVRDAALAPALRKARRLFGGVLGPANAYLLQRGLKTLAARMAVHEAGGRAVAAFLEAHPAVAAVRYPGLASHPDHARASRLLAGYGGLIGLVLADGVDEQRFVDALELWQAKMSYGELASRVLRYRHRGGIRLSVGLEGPEELIADLDRALRRAAGTA